MHGPGLRITLVSMACLAVAGALIVGIGDNPPGIALLYGVDRPSR